DGQVEDGVDDDREPAVHVQEADVAVGAVGQHEAGDAEHQHVHEEEGVDEVFGRPGEAACCLRVRGHPPLPCVSRMNRSRSRVARRPQGPRIVRVKSMPRSHRMTRQANLLLLCACALALSACHRATVADAPPAELQQDLASVTVTGSRMRAEAEMAQRRALAPPAPMPSVAYLAPPPPPVYSQPANTENYAEIEDN